MSETNVRRSIQESTPFDFSSAETIPWFTEPDLPPLDFYRLHEVLEALFPDAMRQAREEGQI